eukprot:XP_025009077.1 uncharacterized protein LOC112532969 [Gallus gallus]
MAGPGLRCSVRRAVPGIPSAEHSGALSARLCGAFAGRKRAEIVPCSPSVQRPPAARSGLLPFQRSRCHPSPAPCRPVSSLLPQEDTLSTAPRSLPPLSSLRLSSRHSGTAPPPSARTARGPSRGLGLLSPLGPFPLPPGITSLRLPFFVSFARRRLSGGEGSAIFFLSTVEVRDCAHRVRGEGQRRAGLRAQRCRRSALLSENLTEGSWRKAEKQRHTAVGTAGPKALSRSREAVRERPQFSQYGRSREEERGEAGEVPQYCSCLSLVCGRAGKLPRMTAGCKRLFFYII